MSELTSLSIFFPCYNDAGTIASMIGAADMVASQLVDDYEIIVIDDGSTDRSRDILTGLTELYPRLRPIFHQRNQGYGGALKTGFASAEKDFIFYTDGDAQYDVFELLDLARVMAPGVDVVNGYKIDRNDPWHRIFIGRAYLFLMRLMFNFHIRDVDCDFRLIRRQALEGIELTHTSGVICLELVKKLELNGALVADYPVHHYHRSYGKSQFFNFPRLFRTGVNIFKLWFGLRFSARHRPSSPISRVNPSVNPTMGAGTDRANGR